MNQSRRQANKKLLKGKLRNQEIIRLLQSRIKVDQVVMMMKEAMTINNKMNQ
jgi:hypothetical protein